MLNVNDYIKIILKKKHWTHTRLCQELNKIEKHLGDARTTRQNITNYFNGMWSFGPKVLAKYEGALGLEPYTLINMVKEPITKTRKKDLDELIKKISEVRNGRKKNLS